MKHDIAVALTGASITFLIGVASVQLFLIFHVYFIIAEILLASALGLIIYF